MSYDSPSGYLHKDLSEQMDALAIFQGAIGEEIKRGKPENSLWLVDGLDSVLLLITERLNNHKNLIKPFDHYYETKMKEPVNMLRIAILNNDTAASHTAYKLLVKKCNSCHNLHEVEERAHY
ncbi:MAG: hypothetical protein MUE99_05615 [Chitinophagaceae bacterium]|nr:hypothetical protein [Chitinophagaceae bacterium]